MAMLSRMNREELVPICERLGLSVRMTVPMMRALIRDRLDRKPDLASDEGRCDLCGCFIEIGDRVYLGYPPMVHEKCGELETDLLSPPAAGRPVE